MMVHLWQTTIIKHRITGQSPDSPLYTSPSPSTPTPSLRTTQYQTPPFTIGPALRNFLDTVCINTTLSSHLSHFKPLKMDLIEGSKTSANINQTLGIYPKIETVDNKTTYIFMLMSRDYVEGNIIHSSILSSAMSQNKILLFLYSCSQIILNILSSFYKHSLKVIFVAIVLPAVQYKL
jgi:hypothetical protein